MQQPITQPTVVAGCTLHMASCDMLLYGGKGELVYGGKGELAFRQ